MANTPEAGEHNPRIARPRVCRELGLQRRNTAQLKGGGEGPGSALHTPTAQCLVGADQAGVLAKTDDAFAVLAQKFPVNQPDVAVKAGAQ